MEAPTVTGAATNAAPMVADPVPETSGAGEAKSRENVKQETAPQPRKERVKVNDREEEVDIEELKRHYQKERAADEKFRRAAEIEKRAQDYERRLKEREEREAVYKQDPWKFFEENKLDPDKLAEQRLLKKLELEMMSPAERKAYDLEQENRKLKAEFEAAEAAKKSEQEQLAKKQVESLKLEQISQIDNDFSTAVQELGIKATPALLESVAQLMLAHLSSDAGNKNITAKEALEHVLANQKRDMLDLVQGMSVDDFMGAVSPEFKESIRKFFLKQVKNSEPRSYATTDKKATQKIKSTDTLFNKLDQKYA